MKVKSFDEITTQLSDFVDQLAKDEIDSTKADALANLTGKLAKFYLGQLAYFDQRKSTPVLPFWEPK